MDWIKEKADRVVAKIKNRDGSFKKSVIIPTDYYPLNGMEYRTFHSGNTERITDEKVLTLIDKVSYKIGHCYQNTDAVAKILRKHGYDVKTYVGWLFVAETEFPIHHCWAVINENQVIDLGDDFSLMYGGENGKHFEGKSLEETRELMVSFQAWARGLKNRQRCIPMGTPTDGLYYIGTECEADYGRKLYRDLINKFPNHECERNCDVNGYNRTQKLFAERGLM